MTTLALVVSDLGPNGARVIDVLRRELGVSIPAVRAAVGSGLPVAEAQLFDRRAPEHTERLPTLLERLAELGCQFKGYQVLDGATYDLGRRHLELTATGCGPEAPSAPSRSPRSGATPNSAARRSSPATAIGQGQRQGRPGNVMCAGPVPETCTVAGAGAGPGTQMGAVSDAPRATYHRVLDELGGVYRA